MSDGNRDKPPVFRKRNMLMDIWHEERKRFLGRDDWWPMDLEEHDGKRESIPFIRLELFEEIVDRVFDEAYALGSETARKEFRRDFIRNWDNAVYSYCRKCPDEETRPIGLTDDGPPKTVYVSDRFLRLFRDMLFKETGEGGGDE